MLKVDLNSDLGESFGNYKIGLDEEVIKYVTSVNVACGWHAGDPLVMEKTIKIAKENEVAVGAHPGFPDLMGFGRRNLLVSHREMKAYIKYQLGALMAFAKGEGGKIQHVKPHGAMYNMAAKDSVLAIAIAEAICEVDKDIILLGLANSELIKAGEHVGLKVANEVFADRAYNADGTLVSRSREGAVIHDANVAIARVIRMIKEGKVTAITGEDVEINAQSICVHGDNPEAVEFVKRIKTKLKEEGIEVTSISNFIK
ncbi:LamB/YcsF family protein [Clostridium tetani]|uniref:5-oxoprolinase subunit A n=1 Tax=Clostridium tetani TaxID=1513 RepID=A0ABY0ETC9_CLOTA|nr:5-oxoprolinase subunit PxpA [Clostridium tetani]KHO39896.1 LamB/YcsF family protein [Clostridium tetani]RXI41779.1 LamB/YcsF family protein [Clostridium tetani]RXI57095.1 LamB/YcsF family protein [Clostridium tetani]RXI67181.1 LamB/YcsF family protein [Clostridium tetani]